MPKKEKKTDPVAVALISKLSNELEKALADIRFSIKKSPTWDYQGEVVSYGEKRHHEGWNSFGSWRASEARRIVDWAIKEADVKERILHAVALALESKFDFRMKPDGLGMSLETDLGEFFGKVREVIAEIVLSHTGAHK